MLDELDIKASLFTNGRICTDYVRIAEEALKSALDDYYKKKGLPSPVKMPAEAGHEHEME